MPRRSQLPMFESRAVRTIPQEVAHRLHGFEHRQAARVEKRRADQERWKATPPGLRQKRIPKAGPDMRAIKVTFRAVFEQPIGKLNPSELRLPGLRPVEVFSKGDKWYVRSLETAKPIVLEKLGEFANSAQAKTAVEQSYRRFVQSWQLWGTPPGFPAPVPLQAEDIVKLPNEQYAWKEAEDFTHILHAPNAQPGKTMVAACGADVPAKAYVSTKANVEPTCKRCAEVWREHYATKEAISR